MSNEPDLDKMMDKMKASAEERAVVELRRLISIVDRALPPDRRAEFLSSGILSLAHHWYATELNGALLAYRVRQASTTQSGAAMLSLLGFSGPPGTAPGVPGDASSPPGVGARPHRFVAGAFGAEVCSLCGGSEEGLVHHPELVDAEAQGDR